MDRLPSGEPVKNSGQQIGLEFLQTPSIHQIQRPKPPMNRLARDNVRRTGLQASENPQQTSLPPTRLDLSRTVALLGAQSSSRSDLGRGSAKRSDQVRERS